MTTRPIPSDRPILEELAQAGLHTIATLAPVLHPRNPETFRKRLWVLKKSGYLNSTHAKDAKWGEQASDSIWYLTVKGVHEIEVDPVTRNRLLTIARDAQGWRSVRLRHDLRGSKFRAALVVQEKRGKFAISRWVSSKNLGLIGFWKGEEKRLEPDRLFTLERQAKASTENEGRRMPMTVRDHFFLEIDDVTENIRRSDPRALNTIESKLWRYESLFDESPDGVRDGVAHLGIHNFKLIFLKRDSKSSNEALNHQRFNSIRELLADKTELSHMRRVVRFCYESWVVPGLPVMVEDYKGRKLSLFD